MAGRRLSVRKIKEVLRLKCDHRLSNRQIARSCCISHSTVIEYIQRARDAGLGWPLPPELDDCALEELLFPPPGKIPKEERSMPPLDYLHRELRRKGVTLQLLWHEYKEANPNGYQYSQFCEHYRRWKAKIDVSLRHEHKAGEKLFVDYAGQTVPIVDPHSGEITEAQVFVAALGASNYTYAEATLSQDLPSWINCHVHAFEFFQGISDIVVPDNTKTGVTSPCRYEPDINPTYQDLAEHYGATIIPARTYKPRDKAVVEQAVQNVERQVLAPLRNRTFFSTTELNGAIWEKIEELNDRKFQKLDTTRRELFESLDKPALKPLPAQRYQYAQWKKARVNIDYHIEVDHHYYSVPYQLVKEQVDVRLTAATVEVFHKGRRVASHLRSYRAGKATTTHEHRPKSHQRYLEWTPSRIIRWAAKNGSHTGELVSRILESKPHPEQGYRSCLGIMRLGKRYTPQRLEAACTRALAIKAYSYKSVASILKSGLDGQPLPYSRNPTTKTINHANIRGREYYQ